MFPALEDVGLVAWLMVRERRVGWEIWNAFALSLSYDFFFLCFGLRSPLPAWASSLFLRLASSRFLRLRV